MEYPSFLDGSEYFLGFRGSPGQRFGAQHGLAGFSSLDDRLFVHVVRQADDHHVCFRVVDRFGHVGRPFGNIPLPREALDVGFSR